MVVVFGGEYRIWRCVVMVVFGGVSIWRLFRVSGKYLSYLEV